MSKIFHAGSDLDRTAAQKSAKALKRSAARIRHANAYLASTRANQEADGELSEALADLRSAADRVLEALADADSGEGEE